MNQILRYQFTVADFARMGEVGIFSEDDRVELIDGEVRIKSPTGARHAGIVKQLIGFITRQLADSILIGVQDPIRLSDLTEPQPDISVLRYRDDHYKKAHPASSDILLVIEVADSSLAYDRDEKIPHYAESGIPEVWLVDIASQAITQFTQPEGTIYRSARVFLCDHVLGSQTLPLLQLPVSEIFEK